MDNNGIWRPIFKQTQVQALVAGASTKEAKSSQGQDAVLLAR